MQPGSLTVFLLLLFVLFFPPKINAGPTDFSVSHYTSESGLPQNSVKGLEMDRHGFLWVVTESGIVRFDGQRFIALDRSLYPQLPANRMTRLGLATDRLIYFGDEYTRLYTFNAYNQPVRAKYEITERLCMSEYLYERLPLERRKEVDLENIYIEEHDEHENEVLSFRIRGTSRGFVGLNRIEVMYIQEGQRIWRKSIKDCSMTAQTSFGRLSENLYYIDTDYNIKQVDIKGNISKVTLRGIDQKARERYPYPYSFFEQEDQLYLLYDKGIYKLSATGANELTGDLMLETDIQNIRVYRNYPDCNLQVIGSGTHGLYLFHKKQFKTLTFENGTGNFYPQAPYGDSGALTIFGLIYPHSSRLNYPFEMQGNRSILLDSRGHYWINKTDIHLKTYSAHVTELDEHLKPIRTIRNLYGIDCYRETPDGNIWMSLFQGRQLGKLSGDSIAWLKKVWPANTFITFLPENNEEFWVAGNYTLMKLNVLTGKEQHYKSLEQFKVRTLYFDHNKVLLIGTEGNGFFALKKGKLYQFPLGKNGGLNTVHTFIEDKSGFMWMTTNNGLFRCLKADIDNFIAGKTTYIYYQCFKRESGFNTNEFNGACTPSAIVLGNGKFSFPSLDGLVQFYPDSVKEVLPVNKIIVDKLLVDGKQQLLTGNTINIDPSFKYLEVQISSPYFGNAANQLLEYRLNGLDNTWHPLKEDNTVVFNNLAHGHYNLQFRKRSGFGYNNFITTGIPLSVKPFFYQTWYFLLLLALVLVLAIYLVIRVRYTYLVRRNKDLEREVSQRTLKLKQANTLKEKMLMMVGHDLQSPLHFLGYLSESISEALVSEQHKKAGHEMKNTTKNIYAFVDEFNLWARVQDEQFNVKKTTFSLNALLNELQLFFKEILLLNHNALECTTEEEYELYTNRELLKAVLRNLVDNANKYTHHGTIHIHCKKDSDTTCSICVSDTGDGISPESLIKINNLIRSAGTVADFDSGDRLGYQLIIDFTTRLNAHIAIDSKEDKGTTVLISGIVLHRGS